MTSALWPSRLFGLQGDKVSLGVGRNKSAQFRREYNEMPELRELVPAHAVKLTNN